MDPQKAFDLLSRGTAGVILAFIILSGFFGYWVYGRTYDALTKDRDYWRDLAIKAIDTSDRLTSIMESSRRGSGGR